MQRISLRQSIVRGSAVFASLAALGLAACGSNAGSGNKNLVIASELPVSANDAAIGVPTQNGVELAVTQNANLPNGYKLSFKAYDDVSAAKGKHDPDTGAANMTKIVADKTIIGVVGAFNSGVTAAEMPIAQSQTLTMISPSNTNPGLTLQQYAQDNGFIWTQLHPAGKPDAYFRIPGNDIAQGAVDAKVALAPPAVGGPGFKSVFVVDDNEVYGKGLADNFEQDFKAGGGTVVGTRQSIDEDHTSTYPSLAAQIIAAKPDFVFFGGTTSGGGCLLEKAIAGAGAQLPMEGGDGIAVDDQCTKDAGPAAQLIFASEAAPDVNSLPNGAAFIQAYKAKYNADPIPYSAMAYDAAMVEITAIKNLISAGKTVTRAAVRDEVAGIKIDGVTGSISFDANGDNAGTKVFSFWVVGADGKWAFKQNVNV